MQESRIAAKGFVINKDQLLVLKRSDDDYFMPGIWELPGGRLQYDEDPKQGLVREIQEETGIEVEVVHALNTHHFTHKDGKPLTMIIFVCTAGTTHVQLSDEHTHAAWIPLKTCKEQLNSFFHEDVDVWRMLNDQE